MSVSARQVMVATAALIAAILVMSYGLRQPADRKSAELSGQEEAVDNTSVDVRSPRRPTRRSTDGVSAERVRKVDAITTGVKMIPTESLPVTLPPVSGFVVDSFDEWTTIPEGYRHDGIMLHDGAITLTGDPSSTATRFGELESPALALRAPAMAAPVANPVSIPEGASISLEISLSDDGETWSPWTGLEKYQKPDGKRVTPQLQASISEADVKSFAAMTSGTVVKPEGPAIRYRLYLSASNVTPPSISDIRIWKRESQ